MKLWLVIAILMVTLQPRMVSGAENSRATLEGTSADMWGAGINHTNAIRGGWLKNERFAMFVHWGLFSELGDRWNGTNYYGISEWLMNRAQIPAAEYAKTAAQFDPTNFNARDWADLARAAGMSRIVITAKHHEGFAMFISAASPFNIVQSTPFKRDPMKELAAACRTDGLQFGFYYSQSKDWHEHDAEGNTWDWPADGHDFEHYLNTKAVPQIKELLTAYGPLGTFWFDTPGPITPVESKMLVDLVHQYQPQCLVNSRIGNGYGDYDTLGDQEIPLLPRPGLWESIDTMNDTWGYAWYDHNWKSPREVVERLASVVSYGGSYMLNVGPDGTGRIPEQCARILREVGEWVRVHEAAINGTDPTPFGPLAWGACTQRGNNLFLFVFHWPADGRLIVPGLQTKVLSARLEGVNKLTVKASAEATVITLPCQRPDSLIPVVTVKLAGPVQASREDYVLNTCSNPLETGLAALSGCQLSRVEWMEKFGDWKHADCLGGWQGAESSAKWDFRTLEPGSFYLDVEYTCPAQDDYSEWRVRCGDTDLTFPLIDTGERSQRAAFNCALPRFRTYRVGMIDLPNPGAQRLNLNPTGMAGKDIRISALRLTPVE